jgi:ATP-binding cassette subfamily B protein/ATP-binding cassette subfamily C protein
MTYWGIKRMFRVAPFCFILLFMLSIISGTLAPATTLIWTSFLNQMVLIVDESIKIEKNHFIYLLLLSLFPIMNQILLSITHNLKQTYSDILDINITKSILEKTSNFSQKYFDQSDIYNDINIATSRTSQNCMTLLDSLTTIVLYLVQATSFIIILFKLDWLIVIFTLLSAIPIFKASIKSNRYWFEVLNNRIEKQRLISFLKTILIRNDNIKEIKLFAADNKIIEFIIITFNNFLKSDKIARRKISFKKTLAQIIDEICSFLIKVWILLKTIFIQLSVGNIVLYFNAHENMKSAVTIIMAQISQMHDSVLYMKAIRSIEETELDKGIYENVTNNFSNIEFKNVSFTYPGQNRQVINKVSFRFERGKTYSIIGLNGSGKTTLLKLLLGIYEPTEGEVLIDGVNLKRLNKSEFYNHVSAVFQDFIKYPFSLKDNILLMDKDTESNILKLEEAIKFASLQECIHHLPIGMNTLIMKDWNGGTDISQGQWQKVAIARCYYKNADIFILDEPFASIDVETENSIIQNMKALKSNSLNIFVTHRFTSISMADEIIVMEDGKIIERGKHNELLDLEGKYCQLYNMQLDSLYSINNEANIN